MFTENVTLKRIAIATFGALFLTAATSATAFADPPRWVKKHGHYVKVHHKHGHWKRHHRAHRNPRQVRHRRIERTRIIYRDTQPVQAGSFSKTMGGGIIGALLGAATGTQLGKGSGRTAAILGGAVLGAVVGGHIGQQMEETDRRQSQQVLESVPTGQSVSWRNPDTGNQYQVTPTRTYQKASGQNCRDYMTWVFIDGYEEQVQGTACRTSDGKWAESNS